MEKKYIEVNELLKSFTPDCIVYSSNKPIKIDLRLIKRIITRQPIADVAEVKHGEWVSLTECSNAGVYCSLCHKKVYKEDYAWCNQKNKLRSDYCPNCGAKMDGGKAE